jgi:glycosyltransferase involved in cell wall biosynthesis
MLDYILSGLPEKEALGLNLIEAQVAGVPVIAVDAPPFTETVADGLSGFLYRDPRDDGGKDFAALIERITNGHTRLNPHEAVDHLARFSFPAFQDRVERALRSLESE